MNKLLIFSASWCAPCKQMKPIIEELSTDPRVVLYDFDNDMEVAREYQIPGVPCYLLVNESNEILDTVLGVVTKARLEALLHE